jgi:hypothetical protein
VCCQILAFALLFRAFFCRSCHNRVGTATPLAVAVVKNASASRRNQERLSEEKATWGDARSPKCLPVCDGAPLQQVPQIKQKIPMIHSHWQVDVNPRFFAFWWRSGRYSC